MPAAMPALEAITSRRSIRAFLDKAVPHDTIESILEAASRAPSGTNMQPWQVTVLTGKALKKAADTLEGIANNGEEGTPNYKYYPVEFREPYLSRRRKVGFDMYGALGIQKGDKARMHHQHVQNFRFFDAPVGLFFFIDADLELGSWLDYGMFIQNVMVAARAFGLDTCPQAAFTRYHKEINTLLGLGDDKKLVCGMALGYADISAPINTFAVTREPVASFTRFVDTL
jgi:nitroreductase